MVCIITDNFRKKNLRYSLCNVFYLTVLGGESFFAADHITKRTFLSLLNEIYSLLLPVQLDKLELVCQSAVYQGGTCYQKPGRLET